MFTYIYIYVHPPEPWDLYDPKLMRLYMKTRKRKGRVVKDDSKPIMAFGKMGCFDSQPLLQLLPGSDLLGKLWWISGSGGCSSHTFTVLYCNYNIIIYKYIHTRILYICIFSWPTVYRMPFGFLHFFTLHMSSLRQSWVGSVRVGGDDNVKIHNFLMNWRWTISEISGKPKQKHF